LECKGLKPVYVHMDINASLFFVPPTVKQEVLFLRVDLVYTLFRPVGVVKIRIATKGYF